MRLKNLLFHSSRERMTECRRAEVLRKRGADSAKTGRSFEATPLVKGMSASQISPAFAIVVKTLVFRGVTVQKRAVIPEV